MGWIHIFGGITGSLNQSLIVSNPLQKSLSPFAKVKELINPDTSFWNRKLISQKFSSKEAHTICSIPLSSFEAVDRRS